jgi:transposase
MHSGYPTTPGMTRACAACWSAIKADAPLIATTIEAARAESMTLKQIAQHIEDVHGVPFPCRLDTLSAALKRAGFSYKRGRYSLKKSATNRSFP